MGLRRSWSFGDKCVPKLEFGNEGPIESGGVRASVDVGELRGGERDAGGEFGGVNGAGGVAMFG